MGDFQNTIGFSAFLSFNNSNSNNLYGINISSNETTISNATNASIANDDGPPAAAFEIWQQVLISIALGILAIGTIIGNSLVCIAVAIVKRLQNPSNLLIVSLALSDLLVAVLVMPFSATYDVLGRWPFDKAICYLWTSLDVLMCTASILNLCMISVDRYFVITRPFQYGMKRTPRRMALMIGSVWLLAALISMSALIIWKPEHDKYKCVISQTKSYQIYATVGAFYLPLVIMIVIYFRIWRVSSRIHKHEKNSKIGSIDRSHEQINLSTKSSRSSAASEHLHIPNGTLGRNGHFLDNDESTAEMLPHSRTPPFHRRFTFKSFITRTTNKAGGSASSRERKATKTLGIIMGGFTLCWLPFFILAIMRPFLVDVYIPLWISSCLMWLGYFNSFMNPIIYARFNREFRTPFIEVLCFRCKGINSRLRSESYAEQYGPDHIRRDRDSLRPPRDSVVRYNSHGHTHVHLGNGNSKHNNETKI